MGLGNRKHYENPSAVCFPLSSHGTGWLPSAQLDSRKDVKRPGRVHWGLQACPYGCRKGRYTDQLTGAIGSPAKGLLVLFILVGMLFLEVPVQYRRFRALDRIGM